jgi:CubicO group peptidase (beta-lactamase class C family)
VLFSTGAAAPVAPWTPSAVTSTPDEASAIVVERYRALIPELMAEQGIPGVAVAVVDGDEVLWAEGFGRLEREGSARVTTDTAFSVQSMSKLFTATAVMIAVQDGLLELDEPISTYLPEFTVNSAFDEHPERMITLRMLLGHTAGFTHEAPIGNNFELDPGEFDAHVASISDTWLRFPVGTGYAYSNLGIDLAGYILQRVHDRPFPDVMRATLLGPLGMDHSTFDRGEIRATVDRAVGHLSPVPEVPLYEPMTAAGGLYTSADDLARFLRFQLNEGTIDGRTVLDSALMAEMRTVPEPHEGALAGYALGVVRHRWVAGRNADLFDHGGGGFGFLSDLWWLPQIQLGIAVLTNSQDHALQGDLALSILRDLTHEPGSAYQERLMALPDQAGATEPDGQYRPPANLPELVTELAMPPAGDEPDRWAALVGEYRARAWGVVSPIGPAGRFIVQAGEPYIEVSETATAVRHRLTEIERSLFVADNGEILDFRGDVPTWRNIELVRAAGGPAPWQWIDLGLVGLLACAWLVIPAVGALRRRPRAEGLFENRAPVGPRRLRRLVSALAALTAILTLATIGLLVAMPGLVDSGFVGWLEFPLPLRLALHLPLALAVVGGCLIAIGAVGWVQGWMSARARVHHAIFAAATALFLLQLGSWRLIGWGLA